MLNIPLLPFEAAQQAVESLTDPRVKSQLLSELAGRQLSTGQFDAALQTFAAIPLPLERRIALLVADFQSFPSEKIEPLLQLLKTDTQTSLLAGRLAVAMLETNNTDAAWKLIETDRDAFETDQQQYEFFEKALPLAQADDWTKVLRLYRTIAPGMYQDWASLALIKYLAERQRADETEKFIHLLSSPLRSAWAYWIIDQRYSAGVPLSGTPASQSERYFAKALETAEEIEITTDDEGTMENLAVLLRIFGRAAFKKNQRELGERLLERSEAAAAVLTVPVQRYRAQCFLGKVLLDLGLIVSIREYLPIDNMLESQSSALNRSRVSVWLAETGWSEGWTKAIEAMAVPERGTDESDRVQQITDVLKRFVAHHQGLEPTGNPLEDAVRLSGEAFETLYFDPFAEWDCGC